MPRIYASNSDPHDYCLRCYPDEGSVTWHRLQNMGDGPDGRGDCFDADSDHPSYREDEYRCFACNRKLTSKDDYLPSSDPRAVY